jgi:hypothetical protein
MLMNTLDNAILLKFNMETGVRRGGMQVYTGPMITLFYEHGVKLKIMSQNEMF